MNIKQIIQWTLHRWWWFVISVAVCGLLAVVYFVHKTPKFSVEAVLMLRQTDNKSGQDEMLQMMGWGGNKIVGDEVKMLCSRELMGHVVDSLGLCTNYYKKGKRTWREQYPCQELQVQFMEPVLIPTTIKMCVKNGTTSIRIKQEHHSEHIVTSDLSQPIATRFGHLQITLADTVQKASYRVKIMPRVVAIEQQLQHIKVNRLSRESNVITLAAVTACPSREIATINTLLDLYNQSAVTDKNRVAVQTDQFLKTRISIVEAELTDIEAQLEAYKRTQQIANLDEEASTYQQKGLAYQQQMAELESELSVLDFMAEQLSNPANRYTMIPGSLGISDPTLALLIQDYNNRIAHRNHMLQTATDQNPIVKQETEQIDQKRTGIQEGIVRARHTLSLRKNHVSKQQQQYDSRLANIPQTERVYLELNRAKQTKEKQYLYLIEKHEENALQLASEAVPAKIVDRAQLDPTPVSPKLKMVALMALLMGLLLPYSVYAFDLFRKEYL
ncbi:MAG: Wzz/FepE/Etk N-terminal domain-containing protein [Paludibacteraceae bacterium]|nr:Wzz/FepE/Etk N-terminal domain-containing protein [Paludibacteraceae bacterium]